MNGVTAAAAMGLVLLSAAPAGAQGTPAPLISLRLGAVTTHEVCQLSRQSSTIGPTMGASSVLLTSRDLCRRSKPIKVKRAHRLTVRLRDPAAAIGATLHAGAATVQLTPQPAGPAPSATWSVDLPVVSGSLVLVVWYPQVVGPGGSVAQDRRDFKVRIRRPPGTRITPNPPAAPVQPAQSYDDSG